MTLWQLAGILIAAFALATLAVIFIGVPVSTPL